jgi:hypothetical protein
MAGADGTDAGEGGSAGAPFDCHGDEAVTNLPSCDSLAYNDVSCDDFTPPEPLGVSICNEWAEHATPEAFEALFACLNAIDETDQCSEAHDTAVRTCRDEVSSFTCRSELARTRCANLGCDEIETDEDGACDIYLSSLTASGVQHLIDCVNEGTGDEPGGTWGAPPTPPGVDEASCDQVFLQCLTGTLQPEL